MTEDFFLFRTRRKKTEKYRSLFVHILEELRELHKTKNYQRLQYLYDNVHITLVSAENAIRELSDEGRKILSYGESQTIQDELTRTQKGIREWENGIYGASGLRRRIYNLAHWRKRVAINTYSLGKRGA